MAIIKRVGKDGRASYQVRLSVTDGAGKRHNRTVGTFSTKKEAERVERAERAKQDRGLFVDPTRRTVGELLEAYLAEDVPARVRPENRQEYEVIVKKHLLPELGTVRAQKLTVADVEGLFRRLRDEGYSSSLVKKCKQRLGAALAMAERRGELSRNVARLALLPRQDTVELPAWSANELQSFLASVEEHAEFQDVVMYRLMAETGMRTSEVLGLQWAGVDWATGTIRVGDTVVRLLRGSPVLKQGAKTEAGNRRITVSVETLELLRELRKQQLEAGIDNRHGLVFPSPNGAPQNARGVMRRFDRQVGLSGLRRVTLHSLRRSAVSLMLDAGVPLKSLMQRTGHRDPATVLRSYARSQQGGEDLAARVLGDVVSIRKTS